jgi:polyphosphate kinase
MSTPAKAAPAKRKRTPVRATSTTERRNGTPPARSLDDPSLYINRELSLIDFQRRVLEEAQDSRNPVLERLMFLSFVGSNIDEFFMVRVAGLKRQIEKGVSETSADGMTAAEQLRAIRASVIRIFRSAHDTWTKELVPALDSAGIHILNYADLSEEQRATANSYFQENVFPTLTPLAFDPGRPFPHI